MTEWDHRQLCSDGGCVGVIGSDGVCKVCGRAAPNWGDERQRGLVDPPEDDEGDDDDESVEEPPVDVTHEPLAASDPEWTERKLCPDGGCIGVLGDDGKCKVCGRSPA